MDDLLKNSKPRSCVFLDRDGVLNVDLGYTYKPCDLRLVDGAVAGLKRLHAQGLDFVIITNQSGVARGLFTMNDVAVFNDALVAKIKSEASEVVFLDIMICPHHPEGKISEYAVECNCRKPAPGLVLDAAKRHNIDLSASWLIGDKISDIDCARNAGIPGIQVTRGGKQYSHHDSPFAKVETLDEAAAVILKHVK